MTISSWSVTNLSFIDLMIIVIDVWGVGLTLGNFFDARIDLRTVEDKIERIIVRGAVFDASLRVLLLLGALVVTIVGGLHVKHHEDWVFYLRSGALFIFVGAVVLQSVRSHRTRSRIQALFATEGG